MKLSNTQLFRGIEETDIESLLGCFETREVAFKKGEYVLKEGNPTEYIGIVLSGAVIIELSDVWGNNSVINRIDVGGTFAEAYACIPGEPMMVNARSAEDSTVLMISMRCVSRPCSRACTAHSRLIQNLLTLCAEKTSVFRQECCTLCRNPFAGGCFRFFRNTLKKPAVFPSIFRTIASSLRIISTWSAVRFATNCQKCRKKE